MTETSFQEFNPRLIAWQWTATKDIFNFDFSKGIHEVLLSGSVGSAKSLFMAHQTCRHLVQHSRARAVLGRLTRPDLKDTLVADIFDHIEGDFVEGEDYEFNKQDLRFKFRNGSEAISRTWHDGKITKFRSIRASWAAVEELTENTGKHWDFYDALYQRLGRLTHVDENVFISATNPDGPSHPAYKKLILGSEKDPLKHVYYSLTTDNVFLPDWYVSNLLENLSPLEAQRMIEGKWVDDPKGGIYYNYKRERNYREEEYIFNLDYPIDLMHDFNIAAGKPMSAAVGQFIDGVFHIAKDYIIHGTDTHDIMNEMAEDGLFERRTTFRVFGDASGKNRDTRSKTTDYHIIRDYLSRYLRRDNSKVYFEMKFPQVNPPIRKRHNRVNAKFLNYNNQTQLYIYKSAERTDDGFRNTKLKKGGQYLEDDSFENQHITTAVGYWVVYETDSMAKNKSKQVQL